jgi:hypothetical protein
MDSSAGCRCREAPCHRFLRFALIGAVAVCAVACQRQAADTAAEKPRPQQAGQPVNPYATAGHIAGARAALLAGNQQAAQQHVDAMARDLSRSARLRDTRRPIDHEAARAVLRPIPGVRSAIWLDADNLAVMVDGQPYRDMDMIDRLCVALEPLGDTLGVVVNLQDAKARNGDEATTQSRNCQLPEGQRAFRRSGRWMWWRRR